MKCSVLGHKYGPEEARTETNASDNGDIETLQRVKECTRCDHVKVVSENKQVRPNSDSSEGVAADGGEQHDTASSQSPSSDGLAHGYDGEDDALIIGDNDTEGSAAESPTEDSPDADDQQDAPTGSSYQTRDLEANEEGVAFIGGDDDDSTEVVDDAPEPPEESDTTDEDSIQSGRGVKILDSSDSGSSGGETADDGGSEDTSAQELEDPSDFTGGSDAVFVDDGPSDGGSGTTEQQSGTTADVEATSGSGDAVIIPGSDDSGSADSSPESASSSASMPDSSSQADSASESRSAQSSRSERPIPDDARYLVCPGCSYREAQTRESRWKGDACPNCRKDFLEWEDE